MSINHTVTPDMVAELRVSTYCMQSYPCQHDCEITLKDGREASGRFNGRAAQALICSLNKDAQVYGESKRHFVGYEDYARESKTPAQVLTNIFTQSILKNSCNETWTQMNALAEKLIADTVESIQVQAADCSKNRECVHQVRIQLITGQTVTRPFSAEQISHLMRSSIQDKLQIEGDLTHYTRHHKTAAFCMATNSAYVPNQGSIQACLHILKPFATAHL